MTEIRYKPIGVIRTLFRSPEGTPIQPAAARGIVGRVELAPGAVDGLKDLDGFSHVILIYHFHEAKAACLRPKPFLDRVERGVFATRSPARDYLLREVPGYENVRLYDAER